MSRTLRPTGALLAASLGAALLAGCFSKGVTPIRTHFNKGVYHYSLGDFDEAIREYRLALEEDPADHRARFNLAEAQEALADRLERSGETARAEELRARAEEHYRTILAERPDSLRAAVSLAAREVAKGDREAGEARLRAAIAARPDASLPYRALAAHALRAAGDDAAQVREAVALLEEALEREPASGDAAMLLGVAHAELARLEPGESTHVERAREAFRKALDKNPYDLATLLALGRLEHRSGRAATAEPWLRRALYVDPANVAAHLLMSEALEARGQLEGATLHLWRARELEDPLARQLEPEAYQRRLLDLYRRLEAREGGPPSE